VELKRFCSVSTILCLGIAQLYAQNLYVPRGIKKAYENNTRSENGKPGIKYWQNAARYNISLIVLPPDRNIKGTENIVYYNNSPDTLKSLNLKLILNIHRPGAARSESIDSDYLTGGIQIDSVFINKNRVAWDNVAYLATNQMIKLPKPLSPHDSAILNITWHYQISLKSRREGMIDSTSYFLGYFYPRIAVYDDYNGWDELPFTDLQEFYNDYSDYEIQVTVPKNYIVWATGTLQNPGQVLMPEFSSRLTRSMQVDSTIHIISAEDLMSRNITTQNTLNSWIWKAKNITDFAIGISNHYLWDATSVVVDSLTNRRAGMQAAYSKNAIDFQNAVQNGRKSLSWLSSGLPGIPYPFDKMITFQGFGNMEYPMMINDESMEDLLLSGAIQNHEISHSYFPFYMGINESRYAFMDEGWAATFDFDYLTRRLGRKGGEAFFTNVRVNKWIHDKAVAQEVPIITPSTELSASYRADSYGKPALANLALKDMLGDELFKKALDNYINNWHGKHPTPWDFFNSMSATSEMNLGWFFNNWFFSYGYIDLALRNVLQISDGYKLNIENIGGFAIPFNITITYNDDSIVTIHKTPLVWKNDQKQIAIDIRTNKKIKSVQIETGIFVDADETNNKWEPVHTHIVAHP
jgi:hypothetical protein